MRTSGPAPCLLAFLLTAGVAGADATVTACSSDIRSGVGTNLATAMSIGGRITFACGGAATIRFTRPHQVVRDTSIEGGGLITLDGDGHRMFSGVGTPANTTLVLRDLTLTRGLAGGAPAALGGIVRGSLRVELIRSTVTRTHNAFSLPFGSILVQDSRFADNDGVVVNAPQVVIRRTRFRDTNGRAILSTQGTVQIEDSEFAGGGTSIFRRCRLSIERSTFTAHRSTGSGGAMEIGCEADLHSAEFVNNGARDGGAIWIGKDATRVSLARVKFRGNSAAAGGGAIAVEPSAGPLSIALRHAVFTENRAARGGAIEIQNRLGLPSSPTGPIVRSPRSLEGAAVLFRGNTAAQAGAVFASDVRIQLRRGIFLDNAATAEGGAVVAEAQGPDTVELANSLVARNRASAGSVFVGNGARFVNTTIAGNQGLAIVARAPVNPVSASPRSDITFVNTIVAHNESGNCGPAAAGVAYVATGPNLQFPGGECGGSIAVGDPLLDPMFVPAIGSPALAAGDGAICRIPPVGGRDVYWQPRPRFQACSIGAVEGRIEQLLDRHRRRPESSGHEEPISR